MLEPSNHQAIKPSDHSAFMRHALLLARRNLGQTWPNPAVGAVVVNQDYVVGVGWTARCGRPHAETQALNMAGAHARGATLYVSLEPCAHEGKTPPCTQAIIAAGVARVVVGCGDPNPRVNGQGIAQLRAAGIEVVEQVRRAEAEALNEGFFSVVQCKRPYVALKIATSLDGKITGGKDRWLTGETARAYGHVLRAEHDAILTGMGTVLADDPLLTCRLPGLEDRSPVRVVIDRRGRMPIDGKLMQSADEVPLWVEAAPEGLAALVSQLAERGITRLMVEAGASLSGAFIQQNLVDRIYWFRAPLVVGDGGLPGITIETARWRQESVVQLGVDCLEIFANQAI